MLTQAIKCQNKEFSRAKGIVTTEVQSNRRTLTHFMMLIVHMIFHYSSLRILSHTPTLYIKGNGNGEIVLDIILVASRSHISKLQFKQQ